MSGSEEVKPGMFAEDLSERERHEWFTLTDEDIEEVAGSRPRVEK